MQASDVIALLELQPHPEGGHYRETFRDELLVSGRAASTAIYFLLQAGETSWWHRVDAAEVWHWYGGSALELAMAPRDGPQRIQRLGPNLVDGARPQIVVPAGHWQRAQSLGAWTLAGCTVAPGFSFSGFELADKGFAPAAGGPSP